MHTKRDRAAPPPVRVRPEPPTVAEAVAAAQALTPDLAQQVEITAGLMGLTPDEVRPFVLEAPPSLPRAAAAKVRARDASMIVLDHADAPAPSVPATDDDAFYARFEVPDDLIW